MLWTESDLARAASGEGEEESVEEEESGVIWGKKEEEEEFDRGREKDVVSSLESDESEG